MMSDEQERFAQLVKEREGLLQDSEERLLEFLSIDLQTSWTFLKTATEYTKSPETKTRNIGNARKGYDTVAYFLGKVEAGEKKSRLETELQQLKQGLEALGERF